MLGYNGTSETVSGKAVKELVFVFNRLLSSLSVSKTHI
jgi:hypothetical protein